MSGDWSCDLPQDILSLILSSLRLMNDFKSFGGVCKQWHLVASDYTKNHIFFGTQWLVKKPCEQSRVTIYHPLADNPYYPSLDIPQMRTASIVCSKDGWLLMNRGHELFFLSPFSKSIINLPNLRHYGLSFTSFTIISTPTSKDWQVCGLRVYQEKRRGDLTRNKFGIFTICNGEKDWTRTLCTVPRGECFRPEETNPIYHKGKYYFLCRRAKLIIGIFDPRTRSWKLSMANKGLGSIGYKNYYLLECDNELFIVCYSLESSTVEVRKLDESRMIWNEVNDIGDYTFFLSKKTSYAKRSTRDYMRNKLFFPYLHENYGVYYCLENNSYQTLGGDISMKKLMNTTMLIPECCWMEPTQHDISSADEIISFDQCTASFVSDDSTDDEDASTNDNADDVDYRTDEEDEECLNIDRYEDEYFFDDNYYDEDMEVEEDDGEEEENHNGCVWWKCAYKQN